MKPVSSKFSTKTSIITGLKYSRDIPLKNHLLIGTDRTICGNFFYSVFRKTMNVETNYTDKF